MILLHFCQSQLFKSFLIFWQKIGEPRIPKCTVHWILLKHHVPKIDLDYILFFLLLHFID